MTDKRRYTAGCALLLLAIAGAPGGLPAADEPKSRESVQLAAADPGSRALADFRARCSGLGVIKCVGFDSSDDFGVGVVSPSADGRTAPTIDTKIYASGGGSARFDILTRSPANSSGDWADYLGKDFGPGDKLHLQFRQRFSAAFLKTNYEPGAGWKQFILYPTGVPSCTSLQFVMINGYLRGFPGMYGSCGSKPLEIPLPPGDSRLQQGDVNCRYQDMSGCMRYRADEWSTFYFEIDFGDFESPTTHIKAWMGYEGKPLKQIIDIPDFSLEYSESPSERINRIQLTPYHTRKNHEQSHPTAHTWYDELIVSTSPILPPELAGTRK